MSTKERILAAALVQFNELGTDQTTVRSIAEAIDISHGNLCYHFKNTDTIIEALYDQLVVELDMQLIAMHHTDNNITGLFHQAEQSFRLLYKYRFLLLDFVRIIRRINSVKEKFRDHIHLRRTQFHIAFQLLISNGLMKEEWIPNLYKHLITNILILGDNWINHAEIHFDKKGEQVIHYYLDAFLAGISPYFTEKGLQEYYILINKREEKTH